MKVSVKCSTKACPTPNFVIDDSIDIIIARPNTIDDTAKIDNDYIIEWCPSGHKNRYYLDNL